MKREIPVHIGLVGHIDSGKTAVAKALSEIISTAGLDAHSQAQKRGITIDLGFTFFSLEEFMVTLVDAPGHANLIRSVVAGANIIDLAVLVLDAVKGPQVQTGEHLMILWALGIHDVIVLVNKTDLISSDRVDQWNTKIQTTAEKLGLRLHAILPVSAKLKKGFAPVKKALLSFFRSHPDTLERDTSHEFYFPFDHYFKLKGKGTVLTGTVLSGSIKVGEECVLLPGNLPQKIKSIQCHKESARSAAAGDRVGIAVAGLDPEILKRGDFLVKDPSEFSRHQILAGTLTLTPYFPFSTPFGTQISVNINLKEYYGKLYPVDYRGSEKHPIDLTTVNEPTSSAVLIWLREPVLLRGDEKILLSRFDLPPTSFRVMGPVALDPLDAELKPPLVFMKMKTKVGRVKRVEAEKGTVIAESLTSHIKGAEKLVGEQALSPFGKILSTFGTTGNVRVEIEAEFLKNYPVEKIKEQQVKVRLPNPWKISSY